MKMGFKNRSLKHIIAVISYFSVETLLVKARNYLVLVLLLFGVKVYFESYLAS